MHDRSWQMLGLLVVAGLGLGACAKGASSKFGDDDDAVVGGGGSGNHGTGNTGGFGGNTGGTTAQGGGGTGQGGQAGGGGCIPGLTPCGNQCVDLLTDELHCGGCDTPCDPGRYCSGGNCLCEGGTTDCGGTCINTLTDNLNCGGCDQPCPADRTCTNGSCECGGGLTDCGGTCVNTQTDHDHCGFLCLPCGADEQCMFGFCTCANTVCGLCPDSITDVGSTVPQTISGSTGSESDHMSAPCGSSGGYDKTYRFTAPAAATYTMSLCNSSYDTVLYVYDMSCSSLACDDDSCAVGLQSQLSVALAAAQQVLIIVDGYDDFESGPFTLTIQ